MKSSIHTLGFEHVGEHQLHYIVMFLDLSCCRNRHAWNINGSFHFGGHTQHAHTAHTHSTHTQYTQHTHTAHTHSTHTHLDVSISCCAQQTVVHTEWAAEWFDNWTMKIFKRAAVVLNVTGDKLYHISCAISKSTLKSHTVYTPVNPSRLTSVCIHNPDHMRSLHAVGMRFCHSHLSPYSSALSLSSL